MPRVVGPRPAVLALGVVALLAALGWVGGSAGSAQAASAVRVTVAPVAASYGAADPVRLRVTFANRGSRPARIAATAVPGAVLTAPLFAVARAGAPVRYIGALAKFAPSAVRATLPLAPGASITRTIDLAAAYDFGRSGTYTVRYAAAGLASRPVAIAVAGRVRPPVRVAPSSRAAYASCSAAQQTTLATALADARTYIGKAVTYLNGSSGARYTTWFGTYDLTRWNAVNTAFGQMAATIDADQIAFDCAGTGPTCSTPNIVAYVNPAASGPYPINLCSGYWAQAATGTDSRAGTIVHELSHFTAIKGTVDTAYGQSGAMALAATPAVAIANADNYEYFAENNAAVEGRSYALDADEVAFGSVTVGIVSSGTITLTSTGDMPLTLGTLTATGGFGLAADFCSGATLAPDATCTFDVTFSPLAGGSYGGGIQVAGDMYMPLPPLKLTGTGVAAAAAGTGPGAAPAPAPVTAPAPRATTVGVKPKGRTVTVTVDTGGGTRTFTVQRRKGSKWRALPKTYTTTGTSRVTLPKGTYRIVVAASAGFLAKTTAPFTIRP